MPGTQARLLQPLLADGAGGGGGGDRDGHPVGGGDEGEGQPVLARQGQLQDGLEGQYLDRASRHLLSGQLPYQVRLVP